VQKKEVLCELMIEKQKLVEKEKFYFTILKGFWKKKRIEKEVSFQFSKASIIPIERSHF